MTLTRRPQSRMAAVTELCFLLFALINNIHAEELITIKEEMDSYTFDLPKEANFCLISTFVDEEKLVLWNTSDLWSHNFTVPEDLKQRLSIESRENISSYIIHNLTHSDSGLYQEECWTEGRVTYEKNSSVIICSSKKIQETIPVTPRETLDLPCSPAAENLDVQWLKGDFRYEQKWTRVFGDNMTSVRDDVAEGYQLVTNSSALRLFNITTTVITEFNCLVMNQQQCVSSKPVQLYLSHEVIYRSVGETAVLPCNVTDSSDDQPPDWWYYNMRSQKETKPTVDQNYSLVFPSLTLNHSDLYYCQTSMTTQTYILVVCPKFGPPAVKLFSEGEKVTIRCNTWEKGMWNFWFIKSNKTGGRVVSIRSDWSMSRVSLDSDWSLIISNVSVKDTGEYWCASTCINFPCVSTSKTLLIYRDPFGIHSTFYSVRCSVLSGLLVMLCVVVVAVNWRTRRGELFSAQTHS